VAKSVKLPNGKEWKSQTAAREHFKAMLYRYGNDQTISDSDDHDDLCALVERFDALVADGAPKNGEGISRFERRLNRGDGWSSPGFWIVRTDSSETDFSYVKAIEGKPKPKSQEFYDACHNAVSRDLLKFKQHQFDYFSDEDGRIECDITGMKVSYAEATLSHADPLFSVIVNQFKKAKGWSDVIPDSVLTVSADKQLSSHFAKDSDAEDFRRLHHGVAVLRIVSKSRPPGALVAPVKRPLRIEL
jgi:hypothetical protein